MSLFPDATRAEHCFFLWIVLLLRSSFLRRFDFINFHLASDQGPVQFPYPPTSDFHWSVLMSTSRQQMCKNIICALYVLYIKAKLQLVSCPPTNLGLNISPTVWAECCRCRNVQKIPTVCVDLNGSWSS